MRHTLRLVAAVAALAIGVAACSSTSKQVSDKIAANVEKQLNLSSKPPTTCPKDAKAKKGEQFDCSVTVEGQAFTAKVTFTSDSRFSWKPDGFVGPRTNVEKQLESKVAGSTVTCGSATNLVITPSHPVTCTAKAGTQTAKVQVSYENGSLSYKQV